MKIQDWGKHQHYKKRCPPWIKLHREILDSRKINELSDASFRFLVGLWLLASESEKMDGTLPSIEDIAYRLRITVQDAKSRISEVADFLVNDDSNVIAMHKQEDHQETETKHRQRQNRGKTAKAVAIEDEEAPF